MYSVSTALYEEVTARLEEAVGRSGYFSGTISGETDEVAWRLTASVLVYRRRVSLPEGDEERIADLVPVWWEFHTVAEDGEILNDFSFGEVRDAVRNL